MTTVDILRDNERLCGYETYRVEWMYFYRLRTSIRIRIRDGWNRRVERIYYGITNNYANTRYIE
jgi:hypothetical protein